MTAERRYLNLNPYLRNSGYHEAACRVSPTDTGRRGARICPGISPAAWPAVPRRAGRRRQPGLCHGKNLTYSSIPVYG